MWLKKVRLSIVFLFLFTGVFSSIRAGDQSRNSFEKQKLTDQFYGEGAHFGDINKDGHKDVISGPFWYEGPDFEERYAYYASDAQKPKSYSDNFLTFTHDFNQDGWLDILVIGKPGKKARWYENPGENGFGDHWTRHIAFKSVDNESPQLTDITGDGRPELVCQYDHMYGYAKPNPEQPEEEWTWTPISKKGAAGGKYQHGLGIGDIDGDDRKDLIVKNGWWEQPESLKGSPKWTYHSFHFSEEGGAQMLVYDVNGDGANDVITALDAHGYGFAWFEQKKDKNNEITFKKHMIMPSAPAENKVSFSQLHALDLVDINNDGVKDVVTGKRWMAHNGKDPGAEKPAVLYWFQLKRKNGTATFIPHEIDNDSGVGTQVVAGDVTGDGWNDVIVGNKKGTYLFTNQTQEDQE